MLTWVMRRNLREIVSDRLREFLFLSPLFLFFFFGKEDGIGGDYQLCGHQFSRNGVNGAQESLCRKVRGEVLDAR